MCVLLTDCLYISSPVQPFTKELLSGRERQVSRHESGGSSGAAASETKEQTGKRFKDIKYRSWTDVIQPPNKYRKPSDNELTQVGAPKFIGRSAFLKRTEVDERAHQ